MPSVTLKIAEEMASSVPSDPKAFSIYVMLLLPTTPNQNNTQEQHPTKTTPKSNTQQKQHPRTTPTKQPIPPPPSVFLGQVFKIWVMKKKAV